MIYSFKYFRLHLVFVTLLKLSSCGRLPTVVASLVEHRLLWAQ